MYVYTQILSPGDTTTPLCDYMQLITMTFKTYADITDDDLNISYDSSIVDATELKLDSKDSYNARLLFLAIQSLIKLYMICLDLLCHVVRLLLVYL